MAKELIRIFRTDEEGGHITLDVQVGGNRYGAFSFANQAELLAYRQEWANDNPQAAAALALVCYLGVDPTGANPALLTDVVTEFDSTALTIVRRSAAL